MLLVVDPMFRMKFVSALVLSGCNCPPSPVAPYRQPKPNALSRDAWRDDRRPSGALAAARPNILVAQLAEQPAGLFDVGSVTLGGRLSNEAVEVGYRILGRTLAQRET